MFADCSSSYSIFDYLVLGKLPWTLRLVFYGVLVLHWNELLFCLIIDQLWEFSTAFERSLLIYRLVWRVHWNELLFLTFLWLCFSRAEKLGVSSSVSLKWRLSRVDKGWPARIFHWQVYMMSWWRSTIQFWWSYYTDSLIQQNLILIQIVCHIVILLLNLYALVLHAR